LASQSCEAIELKLALKPPPLMGVVHGQEVNYSSGEGPFHASCHSKLIENQIENIEQEIELPDINKEEKHYEFNIDDY